MSSLTVLRSIFSPRLFGIALGYAAAAAALILAAVELPFPETLPAIIALVLGGVFLCLAIRKLIRREGQAAEQRATDLQLRESEQRFRELAELLPQAVFEARLDGTITYTNAMGFEIFRRSPEELKTGLKLTDIVAPEDRAPVFKAFREIAAGRKRTGVEYRGLRGDGTFFPILVYSSPVEVNGRVVGLRGIGIDLTERKKVEEALRRSEEKFAKAFQTSPDSVNINRLKDGLYVAINDGFTRMTGFTAEDVAGKTSADINIWTNPDDRSRLVRGLQEEGGVTGLEAVFRRKDGTTLVGLMSARTLDIDGELCLINITRDITERKKTEEAIAASLREKELLLKEIHHRVKNNLQVISSLLNLQAGALNDARDRELFQESQDRIRSMALVHEKLYQSGDLARVDFRLYLEGLLGWLLKSYRLPGVECTLVVDEVHLTVDMAIPCGLIVNELVTNALKHAFPDGRPGKITVTLRQLPDSVFEVQVADDGVGLPPAAAAGAGTSLGLRLVQILSDQLGGKLEIESAAGSRFRVTFPAA